MVNRSRVRLLIMDSVPAKYMFTDAEVDEFLTMESQNVHRAAALACLAISADKAKLGKFTLEGYADNEAAAASFFFKLAADYRKIGAESVTSGASWDIVEWSPRRLGV